MRALIRTVLLLSICATAFAADSISTAFDRLSHVQEFAFGGVGIAGTTSQGEQDYRRLLADPSAQTHLEKLYKVGNVQAKLYALVGLKQVAPELYATLAAELAGKPGSVSTMRGCMVGDEPIALVLKQISKGDYDRKPSTDHTPVDR